MKYTKVNPETGELTIGLVDPVSFADMKIAEPDFVFKGHWPDAYFHYDFNTRQIVPEPLPASITTAHVNAECSRRITSKFDIHDQTNAALAGGAEAAEVAQWIEAHRDAAKVLKALNPIPEDYEDDKHWP